MTLTLYKFGSLWDIADPSPFCIKLESYLRVANVDFEAPAFEMSFFKKAPKGKLPFIKKADGSIVGDSNLVIEELVASGEKDLDVELNTEERSISCAFHRLLDEHLYWALLYSRWQDQPGWSVISDMFFGDIPFFMRGLIQNKEQKKVIGHMKGHGLGRHNREEIYKMASKNITALSDYLGDKQYFFGKDNPTFIDLYLHSHIINIVSAPIDNPLKEAALSCQNLVDHALRLDAEIYGGVYNIQAKAA